MTTKQLIEKLSKLPENTQVFVIYHEDYLCEPDIEIGKYDTNGEGDRGDCLSDMTEEVEGYQPAVVLYAD